MTVELPLAPMPATFCIYPWKSLQIRPDGSAIVCCKIKGKISRDGVPMSVNEHSLEEIWNSAELLEIRRAMAHGEHLGVCSDCYQEERAGLQSYRMYANSRYYSEWQGSWLDNEGQTVQELIAETIERGFHVPTPPDWLNLEIGNQCNLKCRMCNGDSSSRIALDRVQSEWMGPTTPTPAQQEPWYRRVEFLKNELLAQPDQIRYLHLLGGETFIIKEVGDMLEHLIAAGVAHQVVLQMTTNASTTRTPWLDLVRQFKHFYLTVSLDGYGKYNEYIRFPSRWDKLLENIAVLRALPKTTLTTNVTVQAYNVLNLVELLRFLDRTEEVFVLNPLHIPPYLGVAALPPRVPRLAIERLRAYAAHECRPVNLQGALGIAQSLELLKERFNPALLRQLMLFTNDLDVTRGQSFRETFGELFERIAETGFEWTDETMHAERRGLPVLPA